MAYGLAESSGGRFTLSSEPGRGTTAEILLPVAIVSGEDHTAAKSKADLPEADAAPTTGGLSVLVVGDDVLMRMGTADMIKDAGLVKVEAGSCPEALAMLRSGHAIDVVVTDQAMPDMTRTQLAAAIRAEFSRLPIILASGYADLPAEVDHLVAAHLSKLFRKEELASTLARTIAQTERVVKLRPRHG